MALVDDQAFLQLISAQRVFGFNLPPDPISRPGSLLAPAINAELAMLITRITGR
jgi:hypothetical protein